MNEIILDGENLTFEQTIAVAYGKPGEPRIVLSEKARGNVKRSAAAVQKLLERGEIAYGAEFFRWFSEEAVRISSLRASVSPGGMRTATVRLSSAQETRFGANV